MSHKIPSRTARSEALMLTVWMFRPGVIDSLCAAHVVVSTLPAQGEALHYPSKRRQAATLGTCKAELPWL